MKVTNTGPAAHKLSHAGKEYLLAPGNSVEIDLTKEEAKEIPHPFVASGKPIPSEKAEKAKGEAK
ncbi:hypothetical protein [Mesorhizobium sp.]|uniref:hypothetical protein n=1 Tax=Mesorhizobium sp. TaxID=1871066 RepID=UPI001226923E|nr:hypothetical protein [Mesorhizobium sp.]TIN80702.1 MAG: hypothetical protein E5Y09_02445 [Mesorhizobium sp.]